MEKKIKALTQLRFEQQSPGFRATGAFASQFNIEPFLIFGEFYNDRSVFGPHPHAGVSVMTYVLPDSQSSFLNRDSFGDHSVIDPGGIHVTQTGTGVYHDELPEIPGQECHAFQIWINHKETDRMVEPKAFHLKSKEVPVWRSEDLILRVIQGSYKNLRSPIELLTKTTLFDVTLQPHSAIVFDTQEMAFVYVITGEIIIGESKVGGPGIVTFEEQGDQVTVKTGAQPSNFMFATATPIREPIVYGGHFIMTTDKQMKETRARLQRGEMGRLNPAY